MENVLGHSKCTIFMVLITLWLSPICTCSEIGNSLIFRTLMLEACILDPFTGVRTGTYKLYQEKQSYLVFDRV